ncbi:phosphoadenylyl-sulfate reductase [Pilimelia columellifera]|uniref:Adenosine 5'-phosphosulfate reductase n=1 Tax=Pilimelia columellifera subsp. columellifera TaxID=706583 RepID=A0ABN3NLB8_9ACTN
MSRRSLFELGELAEVGARALADASAEQVIAWAVDTFGGRFCLASSFGDAVLADLVATVAPGVDVLFLDTGLHFPQTLALRDEVARTLPLRVRSVRPARTLDEQAREHGPELWDREPQRCCALRKVAPLAGALGDYDAWATGLRRDESPTRADAPVVGLDARRLKVKVAPLARWTQADVDAYVDRRRLPRNELVALGYPSIGCAPCTRPVAVGASARSGRWARFEQTECGLHG